MKRDAAAWCGVTDTQTHTRTHTRKMHFYGSRREKWKFWHFDYSIRFRWVRWSKPNEWSRCSWAHTSTWHFHLDRGNFSVLFAVDGSCFLNFVDVFSSVSHIGRIDARLSSIGRLWWFPRKMQLPKWMWFFFEFENFSIILQIFAISDQWLELIVRHTRKKSTHE